MGPNHDVNKDHTGADRLTAQYLGEVVDVEDPLREGRCRVKVFSMFDSLETEDIPWAIPSQKSAFFGQDAKGGAISIPKNGAVVGVRFNNGDLYSPEYTQVQEIGDDIKEDLRKNDISEYQGSHYMLWDGDEQLKMWFTNRRGLTLELKESFVNINQDSKIEIYHKDGLSSIELDGNVITVTSQSQVNVTSNSITTNASSVHINGKVTRLGSSNQVESAVMGDSLIALLTALAAIIDAKFPSTPGIAQKLVADMTDMVLSETVSVGH
jgi:hypothetical protein